jgi:thiol-disulfide isomerase/thioredoxin
MKEPIMKASRSGAALLAVAVFLVSCGGGGGSRQTAATADRRCSGDQLEIGDLLPGECAISGFDGERLTLEAARDGRPAILNFWASWCVYCIKEMPDFQRVYDRVQGRVSFLGLDLLGVQAENESQARALATRTGVRYPLAFDRDGLFYHRICPCGGRPIMPATVFVRGDGTIAHLKFGPIEAAELRSLIKTHLGVEV